MQIAEPVVLRQVRDLGQLISTTFTFLKQNRKPLFRAILAIGLPTAVIGGFLSGGALANLQEMQMNPGGDPMEIFGVMGQTLITMVPGLILLMIGWLFVVGMVHEYVRAYSLGEHYSMTTGELAKRAWSQMGSYFGASFLVGLLSGVGILLCIIPGVYAYTVLCLALASHAIERSGGSGSLGRSNQLVTGDFWATLGLAIVIGLLNMILNWVVQIPFFIVEMVIGINSGIESIETGGASGLPEWFTLFKSVATAVQWCVQMLTYPIVAVCMILKYFSRVEETEGRGLQEKIASFEQA